MESKRTVGRGASGDKVAASGRAPDVVVNAREVEEAILTA